MTKPPAVLEASVVLLLNVLVTPARVMRELPPKALSADNVALLWR